MSNLSVTFMGGYLSKMLGGYLWKMLGEILIWRYLATLPFYFVYCSIRSIFKYPFIINIDIILTNNIKPFIGNKTIYR